MTLQTKYKYENVLGFVDVILIMIDFFFNNDHDENYYII